jgi:hypothetical protein
MVVVVVVVVVDFFVEILIDSARDQQDLVAVAAGL